MDVKQKFHPLKKQPRKMGKTEINAFLSPLAVNENVSVSTQDEVKRVLSQRSEVS